MPEAQAKPRVDDQPPAEKSVRLQRREARMKFVRDAREPRKVRVSPTKEEFRTLIAHPNGGGFRSTGSVEWPLDSFTKRRIRDGDVIVEARAPNQPAPSQAPSGGTSAPIDQSLD